MKIGIVFQEITFISEFPDSNFLLPTFLTGGKWDFQVANLLLATVNFEPCSYAHLFQDSYRMVTGEDVPVAVVCIATIMILIIALSLF